MWELSRQNTILVIGICTQIMPLDYSENVKIMTTVCGFPVHPVEKCNSKRLECFLSFDFPGNLDFKMTAKMRH